MHSASFDHKIQLRLKFATELALFSPDFNTEIGNYYAYLKQKEYF